MISGVPSAPVDILCRLGLVGISPPFTHSLFDNYNPTTSARCHSNNFSWRPRLLGVRHALDADPPGNSRDPRMSAAIDLRPVRTYRSCELRLRRGAIQAGATDRPGMILASLAGRCRIGFLPPLRSLGIVKLRHLLHLFQPGLRSTDSRRGGNKPSLRDAIAAWIGGRKQNNPAAGIRKHRIAGSTDSPVGATPSSADSGPRGFLRYLGQALESCLGYWIAVGSPLAAV